MSVLVIADHDHQTLRAATRSAVAAAARFGEEIHVLLAGHQLDALAQAAARIDGVAKVLLADAEPYRHLLAENLAPLIAKQAVGYTAVVAPATSFGKNILPRAAALLDSAMVSDVTAIVDRDTFVRPIYAGNLNATVRTSDAIRLLTVRATAFEAAAAQGGNAAIETIETGSDSGLSQWVSTAIVQSDRPELATARVVISGGRSLGSAERFNETLQPLAAKLNAALGATRAAVDAGYAPNEWQVGQTGTVVAPELYIAVGVSGATQHVAGMKDSKVIVAINHDPDASIFQWADYGLVADLFESVKQLNASL